MVINDLPIGSRVRLGRYALIHRSDDMFDIDWIKVSSENDFISEKVLCGMRYDNYEGWSVNYDYHLSNIRQFMNSDNCTWFSKTHTGDTPPAPLFFDSGYRVDVMKYPGFLYHFMDAELSVIQKQNGDFLRLPYIDEISGGFQYFKKRGIRAHAVPSYDIIERGYIRSSGFTPYYAMSRNEDELFEICRNGQSALTSPAIASGVRPVCRLISTTNVSCIGDNIYSCIIPDLTTVTYFKTSQPLDWLLGL